MKKELKPHNVAEITLKLKGRFLDLSQYKFIHPIYDNQNYVKIIFKTGRQVSKSTSLASLIILNCFYKPHYNSLYVAPLEQQTYRFSNLYIKPFIQESPLIRRKLEKGTVHSVMVKAFTNGSTMFFSYCQNGVDRIRGISVDEINWDEIQDILYDHIPVVEQCLSASQYRIQRFCGTPKTLENTIEYLWMQSTQNEPLIKCERCGFDNIFDDDNIFDNISYEGVICRKCKKVFSLENINKIQWVTKSPDKKDFFEGYHIPQIIVPRNLTEKNWRIIWDNFEKYPRAKFANEVLGISWDSGGRLITISDLIRLKVLEPKTQIAKKKYLNVVAGVDWGISAINSYTVIIVLAMNPNFIAEVLFFYKFHTTDTVEQLNGIAKILTYWYVDIVGCDHGVGHANNQQLRRLWCPNEPTRVVEYNYVKANFLIKYNEDTGRYSLNRTETLNLLFYELKDQKILFPNVDKIQEVFDDILAEYEEIQDTPYGTSKVFRHPPEVPDDYLHALNFAYTTSKMMAGMLPIEYDKTPQFAS